ncbi:mammalian cell entry protein [Mycolicibacterium moriokaense]|uniref:Mammalian cell entry protein n=1 Tax=Mycolicibacterium moriokaense TaxID=39691 RepID=A0AAD1HC49_9MYCO|nr:MCE family protein [Mycolicibacterium moriokaense]MCV7039638.1 MCE family protein [Mycolicibacterium moriokaense]ORB19905.1 mammalian cell entry protein [Mycolicibacterium moriokaense]BBX01914.1 mammalian cell entry protein [Mycolicibacterium moriokaense]
MNKVRRILWRTLVFAAVMLATVSCSQWRGIANVPLPGVPGSSGEHYTVYIQMPDVLAVTVNSRVRVVDTYVGTVRAVELKNWIATVTVDIRSDVKLPANATAKIGQTSLLGTQHLELAALPDPSPEPLRNGDTIPLQHSSAYPTTERTLASVAMVLRGGGIEHLEVITTEVNDVLWGNAERIRSFLAKLETFITELNQQREQITRATTEVRDLLAIAAANERTLDRVLTAFPPLVQHFADQQELFADGAEAFGRFSAVTDRTLTAARADIDDNLRLLQRPLRELGRAAPHLPGALEILLTLPFTADGVGKFVRGDYINLSPTFDLTLSTIDNSFLAGTRFSGALRALEQSWGRDPNTMVPDIRFTPNPLTAPGGPLVERSE